MSNIYAELREQRLQIEKLQFQRKQFADFVEQMEFVVSEFKARAEGADTAFIVSKSGGLLKQIEGLKGKLDEAV